MLYSVRSYDPNNYGTININLNIPWKCPYVKYYVSSISTKVNILMTTEDDYLLFETTSGEVRIDFKEMYNYSLQNLINYLNSCQTVIEFKNKNNRTISLTSEQVCSFKEGSHRAKLITGLYNTNTFVIDPDTETEVPDLPVLDLANKLYLVSLQGLPVGSNIGNQEYTPSVIANIDTIIFDEGPLIVNYDTAKPIKIKVNTDSLKYLEMRLVDFMYQPIILKSPLFVTLKIKPAKQADIYDVLTK